MKLMAGSERIFANDETDPLDGKVRWCPSKSLWIGTMTFLAITLGPMFLTWSALLLFIVTSGVTLCFGHSVGMHRRLIHSSFDCPLWLEHFCVYLGTLVGMAGPYGMIRLHDFRDWAQRQSQCGDILPPLRLLARRMVATALQACVEAPAGVPARNAACERPLLRLRRTNVDVQQLPWAMLFFVVGGWNRVIWGIFVRFSVCVTGHWLIGHFSHRRGGQSWIIDGVAAQGYNVRLAGPISMGESWHSNYHAFPGSAKMGLFRGQIDLGWWLIRTFETIGLATNVKTPDNLPRRPGLRRLGGADNTEALVPSGHSRARS